MQQEVEKTQIYLLAMSSDTTEDKLTYIQDRLLDIEALSLPIEIPGLPVFTAKLQAFTGDNPEQQFELGNSQGGHYKCSGCGTKTIDYVDLAVTLVAERLSVQDRYAIATSGAFGKIPGHSKPFASLKIDELRTELFKRSLDNRGLRKDLDERLATELRGTQRVLINTPRSASAGLPGGAQSWELRNSFIRRLARHNRSYKKRI